MKSITVQLPHSVNRKGEFVITERLSGEARVDLTFYKKTRSGDLDNRIKPVVNALEEAGLKVVSITARFRQSKNERTVIKWATI